MSTTESILPSLLIGLAAIVLIEKALGKYRTGKAQLKERLPYFDFFKGVCIVLVIMIHSGAVAPIPGQLEPFIWLAVPGFIFVSGYLTARRNPDGVGADYFGRIWSRVGVIYVLFTSISMLSTGAPLSDFPAYLLLGLGNGGSLYFIPVIIGLYIVYPILLRIRERIGWTAFIFSSFAFSLLFEWLNLQLNSAAWNANPYSIAFFGRLLFLFSLGMYAAGIDASRSGNWKTGTISLALFLAAEFAVRGAAFYFAAIFFGPLMFAYLLMIAYEGLAKTFQALFMPFQKIGEKSLLIYMVHGTVIYGIMKPVVSGIGGLPAYLITLAATTLFSYAIAFVFMKIYGEVRLNWNILAG